MENIFKTDAKAIVDTAFETNLFNEDVTRGQMDALEDYFATTLQQRYESYIKANEIRKKYEDLKTSKPCAIDYSNTYPYPHHDKAGGTRK